MGTDRNARGAGPSQDDLVRRLAEWARERSGDWGRPLPAPAPPGALAETEERLGFPLHPLLRRLYTEVADGGFGPGPWSLSPLAGLFPRFDPAPPEPRDWPERVVAVMDIGCAMVSAVDCLDPAGQVLVMDPNAHHSGEPEAWSLDAPSLDAWLEAWLDGTSWLVGDDIGGAGADGGEEGGGAWPTPWEDAAARLAADPE